MASPDALGEAEMQEWRAQFGEPYVRVGLPSKDSLKEAFMAIHWRSPAGPSGSSLNDRRGALARPRQRRRHLTAPYASIAERSSRFGRPGARARVVQRVQEFDRLLRLRRGVEHGPRVVLEQFEPRSDVARVVEAMPRSAQRNALPSSATSSSRAYSGVPCAATH